MERWGQVNYFKEILQPEKKIKKIETKLPVLRLKYNGI
jgi:hypothetical protein